MRIFDTHAHYDDEAFAADRTFLLEQDLPQKGVWRVINCGASIDGSRQSVQLAHTYGYIYAAVGVHPEEAAHLPDDWVEQIRQLAKDPKVVAIGEIGLDYHYEDACPRQQQKEVFIRQLQLAEELDLPVIIHDREAHGDTMELLRKFRPRGVMHCFSGSAQMAKELVSLGLYVGLGGVVTFKNARHSREVAAAVPADRLLTETDAPYMAPVPYRGKRNDSSLIPFSAAEIGVCRGISEEEVLDMGCRNACALFGLSYEEE